MEPQLEKCLKNVLAILQELAGIPAAQIKRLLPYDGFLPEWEISDHNFYTGLQGPHSAHWHHGFGPFVKILFLYGLRKADLSR